MQQTSIARRARVWLYSLGLPALLIMLSSCSFFGPTASVSPAKPATWISYHGKAFMMNYLTSWDVATKDLYLGTSYPQLEILQGMIFSDRGSATTFVQVVDAQNPGAKASVSDLLRAYILGTTKHPLSAANLTTTTIAGEAWSQGSVEKQVSATGAPGGSMLAVKETALAVSHTGKNGQPEMYLIIYQDATSSYNKTNQTFFTRMLNSFHFAA